MYHINFFNPYFEGNLEEISEYLRICYGDCIWQDAIGIETCEQLIDTLSNIDVPLIYEIDGLGNVRVKGDAVVFAEIVFKM